MPRMTTPRPSSIPMICLIDGDEVAPDYRCFDHGHNHKPNPEWWITEDGVVFKVGDRLFNYYDGLWGTVETEPREHDGWFDFRHDGSSYTTILNSVRVASKEPEWMRHE